MIVTVSNFFFLRGPKDGKDFHQRCTWMKSSSSRGRFFNKTGRKMKKKRKTPHASATITMKSVISCNDSHPPEGPCGGIIRPERKCAKNWKKSDFGFVDSNLASTDYQRHLATLSATTCNCLPIFVSFHWKIGMKVSTFTLYEFASSLVWGLRRLNMQIFTSRAEKSRVARIVAIRLVLVFRVLAGNLRV